MTKEERYQLVLDGINGILRETDKYDGVLWNTQDVLREQESEIEKLRGFINGFSKNTAIVVRCEDCQFYEAWNDSEPARGSCKLNHNLHHANWFCADGVKKND